MMNVSYSARCILFGLEFDWYVKRPGCAFVILQCLHFRRGLHMWKSEKVILGNIKTMKQSWDKSLVSLYQSCGARQKRYDSKLSGTDSRESSSYIAESISIMLYVALDPI